MKAKVHARSTWNEFPPEMKPLVVLWDKTKMCLNQRQNIIDGNQSTCIASCTSVVICIFHILRLMIAKKHFTFIFSKSPLVKKM